MRGRGRVSPTNPAKLLDLGVHLASGVGLGSPGTPPFSAAPHSRSAARPRAAPAHLRRGAPGPPRPPAPRHMAPGAENRGPRCSGRPGPAAALARRVLAPTLTDRFRAGREGGAFGCGWARPKEVPERRDALQQHLSSPTNPESGPFLSLQMDTRISDGETEMRRSLGSNSGHAFPGFPPR